MSLELYRGVRTWWSIAFIKTNTKSLGTTAYTQTRKAAEFELEKDEG